MKQVQKVWAELSAKAQEVETPQESTELSEEVKVELAVTDRIKGLVDKAEASMRVMNKRLDSSFTPIREIEDAIRKLDDPSSLQDSFKTFMSNLDALEQERENALKTIKDVEADLGISVPIPTELDNAVRVLEKLQREEELFRKEINEYSQAYKKFK